MSKELWSLLSNIKPSVILQVPYNNAKLAISPLIVQHRDHILQRRCYLPTGKYSALQHFHSTKVSPRHLRCPGTYGNILIKEPEKDLSTTVTLATLAYRCRSGIDRNCFEHYCTNHNRDQTGATRARSPLSHSHTRLPYKHCCFPPQLKTHTGGPFLATTKMKGASELR